MKAEAQLPPLCAIVLVSAHTLTLRAVTAFKVARAIAEEGSSLSVPLNRHVSTTISEWPFLSIVVSALRLPGRSLRFHRKNFVRTECSLPFSLPPEYSNPMGEALTK